MIDEYQKLLWFAFGAIVMHLLVWFSTSLTNWYRDSHLRRMNRELGDWQKNVDSAKENYKRLRQAR